MTWGHWGRRPPIVKQKIISNIIYVISFSETLTKVGRTTNWDRRRDQLTHHGGLPTVAEAVFDIDTEEFLPDVEKLVLSEMREKFRTAAGAEYFVADFDHALNTVTRTLAASKIECAMRLMVTKDVTKDDLSEMTPDQLDRVIHDFCVNHGVSLTKVMRFLGAESHSATMKRTGFVPTIVASRAEKMWSDPAVIFR